MANFGPGGPQPPYQTQYGQQTPQQPPQYPPQGQQYPQQPQQRQQWGAPQQPPPPPPNYPPQGQQYLQQSQQRQQWGAPQQPPQQYGQQYDQQPNYGAPTSLNDAKVVNYSVKTPYFPYKREDGAEGSCVFDFVDFKLKPPGFQSGSAYQAEIMIVDSQCTGVRQGSTYLINWPLEPSNKKAVPAILGKLRAFVAAVVGANPNDPSFDGDAARDKILRVAAQEYYRQRPARLWMVQTCRLTNEGKPVTDQQFGQLA
jgi:hypothetical protein